MPTGVYQRNPSKGVDKEKRNRRSGTYYRRRRDKVIQFLGGHCNNPLCSWVNSDGSKGCDITACLQIDHVNGGGVKELKSMSCTAYLSKVLKDTEGNYQLLCANCNWIKRLLNGEDNRSKKY